MPPRFTRERALVRNQPRPSVGWSVVERDGGRGLSISLRTPDYGDDHVGGLDCLVEHRLEVLPRL
jgi:hypothetical protein